MWPLQPLQWLQKHNSNHLSVHQWIRSAIRDSQQPTSPIGFLFLKLPPPRCAVLLVIPCIITNGALNVWLRMTRKQRGCSTNQDLRQVPRAICDRCIFIGLCGETLLTKKRQIVFGCFWWQLRFTKMASKIDEQCSKTRVVDDYFKGIIPYYILGEYHHQLVESPSKPNQVVEGRWKLQQILSCSTRPGFGWHKKKPSDLGLEQSMFGYANRLSMFERCEFWDVRPESFEI